MPESFDAQFPVSVNSLYGAVCPHLSSALSKFKCLAAKKSWLNQLWSYFLVKCPRLDLNDGITARVCAWMSPEETVVVFVQCFYIDVANTSISNFHRVGTTFSGELPQVRTVLLFGSYSGQIFPSGESNTKFAGHITCCAWSAVNDDDDDDDDDETFI